MPLLHHHLPLLSPYFHRPPSLLRSFSVTIKASSMATTAAATTVEHIVLFSIREDTPKAKVDSMISNLCALSSLPGVSYLHCGPVLRHRSAAASPFSHLLHGRYPSKSDLDAYSSHPSHLSVVRDHVRPISDDILAIDWISPPLDPRHVSLPPGSASRLTLASLADAGSKPEVLRVLGGALHSDAASLGISQVSFGENFSPARAKGYSVAMMAVFDDVDGLEALEKPNEAVEKRKNEVRKLLESVIVLDFVLPAASSSAPSPSL